MYIENANLRLQSALSSLLQFAAMLCVQVQRKLIKHVVAVPEGTDKTNQSHSAHQVEQQAV